MDRVTLSSRRTRKSDLTVLPSLSDRRYASHTVMTSRWCSREASHQKASCSWGITKSKSTRTYKKISTSSKLHRNSFRPKPISTSSARSLTSRCSPSPKLKICHKPRASFSAASTRCLTRTRWPCSDIIVWGSLIRSIMVGEGGRGRWVPFRRKLGSLLQGMSVSLYWMRSLGRNCLWWRRLSRKRGC